MNNKICIDLIVPTIDRRFNIFVPVSKKTIEIIFLLNKAINELTEGSFPITNQLVLRNATNGEIYDANLTLKENNVLNGSTLILM